MTLEEQSTKCAVAHSGDGTSNVDNNCCFAKMCEQKFSLRPSSNVDLYMHRT